MGDDGELASGDGTQGRVRFFVSYTGVDRAWAERIAWELEDAGWPAYLQAWDFVAGENFIGRMNDALTHAHTTWHGTLGDDHPDTLHSAHNLANVLHALGDYPAARTLHEDTLDCYRRALGPDHPHTLNSANGLAETLQALGEKEQARDLYRQAWEGRRRALGPTHPDTRASGRKLDIVLDQLDQPPEAQLALNPDRDHK